MEKVNGQRSKIKVEKFIGVLCDKRLSIKSAVKHETRLEWSQYKKLNVGVRSCAVSRGCGGPHQEQLA